MTLQGHLAPVLNAHFVGADARPLATAARTAAQAVAPPHGRARAAFAARGDGGRSPSSAATRAATAGAAATRAARREREQRLDAPRVARRDEAGRRRARCVGRGARHGRQQALEARCTRARGPWRSRPRCGSAGRTPRTTCSAARSTRCAPRPPPRPPARARERGARRGRAVVARRAARRGRGARSARGAATRARHAAGWNASAKAR